MSQTVDTIQLNSFQWVFINVVAEQHSAFHKASTKTQV